MGGSSSKKAEETPAPLTQQELTYYMGVQTTPAAHSTRSPTTSLINSASSRPTTTTTVTAPTRAPTTTRSSVTPCCDASSEWVETGYELHGPPRSKAAPSTTTNAFQSGFSRTSYDDPYGYNAGSTRPVVETAPARAGYDYRTDPSRTAAAPTSTRAFTTAQPAPAARPVLTARRTTAATSAVSTVPPSRTATASVAEKKPAFAPLKVAAPARAATSSTRPLWGDDSSVEEEIYENHGTTMPKARTATSAHRNPRTFLRGDSSEDATTSELASRNTSSANGDKWAADLNEAMARLSLADARNGNSTQRQTVCSAASAAREFAAARAAPAAPVAVARSSSSSSQEDLAARAAPAHRQTAAKGKKYPTKAAAPLTRSLVRKGSFDDVPIANNVARGIEALPWALAASKEQYDQAQAKQQLARFRAVMGDARPTPAARPPAAPASRQFPYSSSDDLFPPFVDSFLANAKKIDLTPGFSSDYQQALLDNSRKTSGVASNREFWNSGVPVAQALLKDGRTVVDVEVPKRPQVNSVGTLEQQMQMLRSKYAEDFSSARKADVTKCFAHVSLADEELNGTPVYTLSVGHTRVCVFEPAREKFIQTSRDHLSILVPEEGQIYTSTSISRDSIGDLSTPTNRCRKQLTDKASFEYGSEEAYRKLIIPALLLGSRVRDFEQRCATVIQLGELVLNMPAQNNRNMKGKPLKLRTISGQVFEVKVKFVNCNDEDKRWVVECEAPKEPLPWKVRPGAHLEIIGGYDAQPRVTGALMNFYGGARFDFTKNGARQQGKPTYKAIEISNWELLSCIYGAPAKKVYPAVDPINPMIPLAGNKGSVQLNPEQAEAVARYNCAACPAFVVESPPGSGKTMTAAAMAVSYKGDGVQLFLSTANVPVINMALALAKLDYGFLKAIHLISAEREDLMTEETRSPFSVLSLAKTNANLIEKIEELERQLPHAPNDEEKEKIKGAIVKLCGPVFQEKYDIYFATVDMILGRLFKNNQGGKHQVDTIKKQLVNSVTRIVVDEASQLTESALNALILCFPNAQIVLIGDSKQLPPFRYTPGDVVSELAARPALEVIKDKMNLPVIKLNRVYRASPSMMAHYSDCFYKSELHSFKPESCKNPFACFGARSRGSKCLFWKVDKGVAKKQGTSKYNYGELKSLRYIVNMLKNSGYNEKEVMIISYYEAQRKKAEEELKELGEYELLTVDSAQGREKKIVIVMTTRTSVPVDAGAFFNCALRCNVAVSRHQEALIVLGHPSIAAAPNWTRVLNQKYFRHVEDNKAWKGPAKK